MISSVHIHTNVYPAQNKNKDNTYITLPILDKWNILAKKNLFHLMANKIIS